MPNPRKPTSQKIIQGTFRKDRAPKNESNPEKSNRKNPPWWMRGYTARHAWRQLSRYLKENGLLTNLDEIALEMLVTAYSKWREAREKAKIGTYKTETGYHRLNPMLKVEKMYRDQLLSMMREFGMTPSSRAGIDLVFPDEAGKDVIQQMLEEQDRDKKKKD